MSAAVVCADLDLRAKIAETLTASGEDVSADVASPGELNGDDHDVAVVFWDADSVSELREPASQYHVVAILRDVTGAKVRKLVRSGVAGIVSESRLAEQLPVTVAAVRVGQVVLPDEHRQQAEPPALSTREKQILAMVVLGMTNHEIASRLYLTESTVKTHLSSAFSKLGVRSRYEAAALIMDPEQALGPGILHISEDVRAPAYEPFP